MEDMGHKMKDSPTEVASPDGKNKMVYPSLYLSHKIPSDLEDKDVGDMCHLEVMGKIISKSESNHGEEMTIEVHKIGYMGKGKVSKEEYDNMDSEDKDKADEEEVMGEDE